MSPLENRNEETAKSITREISKFVRAFSKEFNMEVLLSRENILAYDSLMKENGVGVEGRLLKVERFTTALKYYIDLKRKELGDVEAKDYVLVIEGVLTSLAKYKKNMRREKCQKDNERLQKLSEMKSDITEVKKIVDHPKLWGTFEKYMRDTKRDVENQRR